MRNRISTDEFDIIWDKVVCRLTVELSKDYNLKYKNLNNCRRRARKLYRKYKDIFIKSYMYWNTDKIDKHKSAACYMKSLLVIKPIYIPFLERIKIGLVPSKSKYDFNVIETLLLINEYLAFSVGVTIVDCYIARNYEEDKSKHPLEHCICIPTPFHDGEDEYIKDVCLDLYYTPTRLINIVTYANIFFLLEKYSCRKIQTENLIDELSKSLTKDEIDKIRFRPQKKIKNQNSIS